MNIQPVELSGGESVYCINEAQLKKAYEMLSADNAGTGIESELERLNSEYSRNERAALAFLLIHALMKK